MRSGSVTDTVSDRACEHLDRIRADDPSRIIIMDLLDEIDRLRSALSAEREECAKVAEDRAFNAKIARDNFKAIGEHADADRHDHYRTSATEIAAAIRARKG